MTFAYYIFGIKKPLLIMKQIYLTALFIFSSLSMLAQFPGHNVSLFNNAELIVNDVSETSRKYGYSGFYKKETMSPMEIYASRNYMTPYESVANKVFKVLEVKPYTDSFGRKKYALKLENAETGIIYYDYNPELETTYPFGFVSAVNLPADFYCKDFARDTDSGVTTIVSPYEDGMLFTKFKEKKGSLYYMESNVYSKNLNNAPEGLIITLENGKTIDYPAETVKVKSKDGWYVYSAYTELKEADVALLLQSKMKTVKLDDFEATIHEAVKLQEYLKCLKKQ